MSAGKDAAPAIFDVAMSIGGNCQSRYNISRILWEREHGSASGFSVTERKKSGKFDYGTFAFDWCVSNTRGVLKSLRGDFAGTFELENLTVRENNAVVAVDDAFTGFSYPHTFHKPPTGPLTPAHVAAEYPAALEKHRYVVDKTLNLLKSGQNILFVLCGGIPHPAVGRIIDCLDQKTERYKILYASWAHADPQIDQLPPHHREKIIWRPTAFKKYPGDLAAWDAAFDGIELRPPG